MLAALATLPLIVTTFGSVPVYTLPANLILVPVYALFVLPMGLLGEFAAILGLFELASALMGLSALAVEADTAVLAWLVRLPFGLLWAITPPLWMGLCYVAGSLLAGWWLFNGQRKSAAVLMSLTLLIYLADVLPELQIDTATWVVWDVGQGASSSLLLPGNQILTVDAPGRSGSSFNGGTTAAGLRSMGVTHVDVMVLSHAQSDHIGGAISFMQRLNRSGEIWLPDVPSAHSHHMVKPIVQHAQKHDVKLRWLARGDEVTVSVLWPPRGFAPANHNNSSLVLRMMMPDGKNLLFSGDIEKQVQNALLSDGIEAVDGMLMPHNGSRSSRHSGFVQQLSPALAVAQAGFANHYGFPDKTVVETYRENGAVVKDSSEGAVIVELAGGALVSGVRQWKAESESRRNIASLYWKSVGFH